MCTVFAGSRTEGQDQLPKIPAALETLVQSYPKPLDDALRGLARAVRSYDEGRYGAVLAEMPGDEAAGQTAIGDYFLLYRAKANLSLEKAQQALELFRSLQKQFPSSPLLSESILGECQALLKLNDAAGARAALQNPALNRNVEALYWQGRMEEDADENGKAVETYSKIYTDYVGSRQSSLAQDRLLGLSPRALTGQSAYPMLLRRAENLLKAGMSKDAQSLLTRLARVSAPDKPSADRRLVMLAQAEVNLGKATAVVPYLNRIGDADPAIDAQALYLKAVCYRRLKREGPFLETRDLALRRYPQSPYTEKILYSVATYFDVADRTKEAAAAYARLAEAFPKGPNTERALWRVAFYAYVDRQYEDALSGFWKYLRAFPSPRSAAAPLYWMARCYEHLGDYASAGAVYERASALGNHGYYGQLAADARSALKTKASGKEQTVTAIDFRQITQKSEAIENLQSSISEPSPDATGTVERARQLASADLTDLAVSELRAGIRRYPEERGLSFLCARLYALEGNYEGVFSILRRAFPDYDARAVEEFPGEVWELLFPFEHWRIINSESAKNNIPASLVLAVIRQESAFRETARSAANARGLMQLLPATGRGLARSSGVRYTVSRLFRADTNIMLGTRFLAALMRQYGGKEELALAAYNAGDSRVDQWMGRFGRVDMAEFVERIPFSETRGYIKQVLTNKAYYDLLKQSLGESRISEIAGPETAPARESDRSTAAKASQKSKSKPVVRKKTPSKTRRPVTSRKSD